MRALPETFKARMRTLLGPEAEALFTALAEPPRSGLRLNPLKLSERNFRQLVPWSLEPLPWAGDGYLLGDDVAAGKHPYHAAGLYYLQEPSAMAVAEAARPTPGELILDLAAAPGGKTTGLVSLSRDRSVVVANEVGRNRVGALRENLERWGATNALVTSEEVWRLARAWGPVFDRVLLDAPCSGEGMFRKSDDALAMWSEAAVTMCARRQSGLMDEAAQLVTPGGLLCYSTCTFAPEENEGVVAAFLDAHPDFALEPVALPGLSPGRPDFLPGAARPDLAKTARLWPHRVMGEGHFIALLRRREGEAAASKPATFHPISSAAERLWRDFKRAYLSSTGLDDSRLTIFGNRLFALPGRVPQVRGLSVLSTGLALATLRKDRLEPAHSLALALSREDAARMNHLDLEPDDPRLDLYLRGHVLEEPGEPGWLLVCVSGFPLGWGRRSGRTVKNAYPKGLRRK